MWLLERPVGGLLTPKRSWFLERLCFTYRMLVRYSPLLQTSGPSSLPPCRPTLAAGDRSVGPGVPYACPTQNQRNCRRVGKHFRSAPRPSAYLSQLPLWINYRHVPLVHFPFDIDCCHSCLLLYYQISRTALPLSCLYTPTLY
jgi:hypothetical protein